MELEKFDMDKLIALRGISPSSEDLPKLKGFDGDVKTLDEVRHTCYHEYSAVV